MTSGEPRPGTGPESLAQDPRAEAARLWDVAIAQFGNPAEAAAPIQEIKTYEGDWVSHFPNSTLLGESYDSNAYRAVDPSTGRAVTIKAYKGLTPYINELEALTALRGLDCVPDIVGRGVQFIVKEFIEGENVQELFYRGVLPLTPLQPGQLGHEGEAEIKRNVNWTVSSLEALANIHGRGFLVNDFKFSDFLLKKDDTVTIIDLGNAVREGSPQAVAGSASKIRDIQYVLRPFFYTARVVGQDVLTYSHDFNNFFWGTDRNGRIATAEEIGALKRSALSATPGFIRIIDLIERGADSAQEYADAIKDYFREVGLYENPVEPVAEPAAGLEPGEPEARPLAQDVETIQKARENLQNILGQWKKTKEYLNDPSLTLNKWVRATYSGELQRFNEQGQADYIADKVTYAIFGTHSLANKLFAGNVLPTDDLWQEVHQEYQPEDEGAIINQVAARVQELGSKRGELDSRDRQWLEAWERHFERLARPQEDVTEIVPIPAEPEAQPDPAKEARDALESELTAIGEFFEGKKPEIGILEDWQAEKMRRQEEWIREDNLAEDVNKWLEKRIAPLIFQARLRGDDQIAKDFVNLCSPDQFDTFIKAVGQLLKEATEKE